MLPSCPIFVCTCFNECPSQKCIGVSARAKQLYLPTYLPNKQVSASLSTHSCAKPTCSMFCLVCCCSTAAAANQIISRSSTGDWRRKRTLCEEAKTTNRLKSHIFQRYVKSVLWGKCFQHQITSRRM